MIEQFIIRMKAKISTKKESKERVKELIITQQLMVKSKLRFFNFPI
jgi:hypothetical protein